MSRMLRQYLENIANTAEAVLVAHRAPGRVTGGTVGPRLIRLNFDPAPGVRVGALAALADDLALALKVSSLRVDRTPAGIVFEIPNPEPRAVTLLPMLKGIHPLPSATAALGLTDDGAPLLARLSSPEVAHCLVSGTTGSGKTALLRTMAVSLALEHSADDLRLLLIDPKGRAFRALAGIPHLLRAPVTDVNEALEALGSLVRLMQARDRRGENKPRIVVFVDELADLAFQSGKVEGVLARLAQRGREAGIHLVAATQRPSAAVISGIMRANFPLRLVGKVVTSEDARIAAGRGGTDAERLSGRGDFLAVGGTALPIRFQVAFIGESEARDALQDAARQQAPLLDLPEAEAAEGAEAIPADDLDRLTERLAPWWAKHGGRFGSKTRAVKFLFGEEATPGGYAWQMTQAAIDRLASSSSSILSSASANSGAARG